MFTGLSALILSQSSKERNPHGGSEPEEVLQKQPAGNGASVRLHQLNNTYAAKWWVGGPEWGPLSNKKTL